MKNILCVLFVLFVFKPTSFASFPIEGDSTTEQVFYNNTVQVETDLYYGSFYAKISLISAVLSVLFLPVFFGSLAIVFGIIGMQPWRDGTAMAVSGIVLGMISLFIALIVASLQ